MAKFYLCNKYSLALPMFQIVIGICDTKNGKICARIALQQRKKIKIMNKCDEGYKRKFKRSPCATIKKDNLLCV